MTSQVQFFPVTPLSSLGRPTLRGDAGKLTIVFPQALAAHLGLKTDQRVHVALGRDRQKAVSVRICAAPEGGYMIRRNGKSIQLRIPELGCKASVASPSTYLVDTDGAVLIDLPQPWELVDERAIAPQPANPRKPALVA
jgi:hypothetical protein